MENVHQKIVELTEELEKNPDHAGHYNTLGNLLCSQKGKIQEGINCLKKSIELQPNWAVPRSNLGKILFELGELHESLAYHDSAIRMAPDSPEIINNYATVLFEFGKFKPAVDAYKKAIAQKPNYASAHLNYTMYLLLIGQFKKGWKEYEFRLQTPFAFKIDYQNKKWDGESSLNGKTVVVHGEQGFGDTIQFFRFLDLLKKNFSVKILFFGPKPLISLLKNNPWVDEFVSEFDLNKIDFVIPILSLPFYFKLHSAKQFKRSAYLSVPETYLPNPVLKEKIKNSKNTFKIGVLWSGNPDQRKNRFRSFSPERFRSIAELKTIQLFSLQKGPAEKEISKLTFPITDLSSHLNDFLDTAWIIQNLDLVISPCTAVAHLAGALGKPVWTLIHYPPDWRWGLVGDKTPWYPSMRLFRQQVQNDWDSVFEAVLETIKNMTKL